MVSHTQQTMIPEPAQRQLWTQLHCLYLLAMMAMIAAILTTAMVYQFSEGELPCPLCLLQRLAMFGVCFGLVLQFRYGVSFQNSGISLLFAIFLLIVSVRQTLLDIYPREGHEYIGSAVFGLHMPVWSVLIALALITAFAVQMLLWGDGRQNKGISLSKFPVLRSLAVVLSLYIVLIAAINTASVFVQCGLGQCHTTGYALLK